jgi:hypothetical protein
MSHWESSGRSDEWYTPKYIFDALETGFDIDVAAPVDRTFCVVPAREFITSDSLSKSWIGYVWMNPPFGGRNGIFPWIQKMYHNYNGIALTPDRTSAPWWQWAAHHSDAVLFINGKVKFIRPDGSTGDSPSSGTTLFAWGDLAVSALRNAEKNNLGKLYRTWETINL